MLKHECTWAYDLHRYKADAKRKGEKMFTRIITVIKIVIVK